MLEKFPLLSRLMSKMLCEILPAALASGLGAVLLNSVMHPSSPPAVVADPANAEMLQMARDEHARIVVYLEKNGEARQLADIAAEKELMRAKAAEQAAALAEKKARVAKARAAAQTALMTEKTPKIGLTKQQVNRTEDVPVIQQPLQLDAASAVTQSPSITAKLAPTTAGGHDNLLLTKWRETTSAVERIPGWVRKMVERLADNVPSPSPVKNQPFRLI